MILPKSDKISVKSSIEISKDSIVINSVSFVIDNNWVSFSGTIFKIKDYISNSLRGTRTKFFKNRNYAVCLLICIDVVNGIVVEEGQQVPFVSISSVPIPEYKSLPLVGVILIQDGTSDLNFGIVPLREENFILFSSIGNIIDKNKKGEEGENSILIGCTGPQGETGSKGEKGLTGFMGITGAKGYIPELIQGCTGLKGMTGINWDIYIPFEELI